MEKNKELYWEDLELVDVSCDEEESDIRNGKICIKEKFKVKPRITLSGVVNLKEND